MIGNEFHGDDVNAEGAIAIFTLADGLVLAVYPRSELAKDAGVPSGPPTSGEFSIGHAVASRDEVDAVLATARAAGAAMLAEPRDRPRASTRATSRTPMGTCGRCCTTRRSAETIGHLPLVGLSRARGGPGRSGRARAGDVLRR